MLESLDTLVPLAVPLAVVLGLVIDSFLSIVTYHMPVMVERGWTQFAKEHLQLNLTEEGRQPFNLLKLDSRCPKYHVPIKAWQNIPIVSYLMLGGKCGPCKAPINIRYPLVELLTGILSATIAWQYGWSQTALDGLILTAMLITLIFIDIDTQYLPDQLTLPLIWLGLPFNFGGAFVSLQSVVLGAVCGYMSLWLLSSFHRLVRGVQGIEAEDFKLLAALGIWLGIRTLSVLVFTLTLVGLAGALIMRVARNQPLALGPSPAIAGQVAFTANESVNQLTRR